MNAPTNPKTSLLVMTTLALIAGLFVAARTATGHCQIPCGIYDDEARISSMLEDAATIAKAINQINELAAGDHDAQAVNQAIRWVNTKEQHATHIITTVAEYFLTQKVKPVAPDAEGYNAYLQKLADHHAVMVAAMKTKQHTDAALAQKLSDTINTLGGHYHNHNH